MRLDGSTIAELLENTHDAKPPRIKIVQSDTFDAVQQIINSASRGRVAALNMASALRPGGGVLDGAVS
jgi:uncharacterized protein (TIGR02452 family)